MKTIEELATELKLNQDQVVIIKRYISELVIEMLQSLRDENSNNFNETIDSLKKLD